MLQTPEIQQPEAPRRKLTEQDEFVGATNRVHREILGRMKLSDEEKLDWLKENGVRVRRMIETDADLRRLLQENTEMAADAILHNIEIEDEERQKKLAA